MARRKKRSRAVTGPNWDGAGKHKGRLKQKMGNPSASDVQKGPAKPPPRTSIDAWAGDMERWGRRVRRDILLLEAYIRQIYPDANLYDDPGDPPPPPRLGLTRY